MQARLRNIAVPALLLLAAGCASGPGDRPRWAEAPDSDLPSRETFAWEDRSGPPPGTLLSKQIRDAIRRELEGKGYRETAESPDFVVYHETIEREAVEEGRPLRIGIGIGSWAAGSAAIEGAVAALMAALPDRGPETP